MARPAMRVATVTLLLAMAGLQSACSFRMPEMPEPWVRPYEREALASPLMALSRDPLSDKYLTHVYETREAARGGTGATGGGCGCN